MKKEELKPGDTIDAISNLFIIKEALASCQIEGIGTDLTVRDVLIAQLERRERERRAARRAAKKPNDA